MSAETPTNETNPSRFAVMFHLVGPLEHMMGQAQLDQLAASARDSSEFLGKRAVFAFRDEESEDNGLRLAYVFGAPNAEAASSRATAASLNVIDTYTSSYFGPTLLLNDIRVASYPDECPAEQVVNYWPFMEDSDALQNIFNDGLAVADLDSEDIDIFFAPHDAGAT